MGDGGREQKGEGHGVKKGKKRWEAGGETEGIWTIRRKLQSKIRKPFSGGGRGEKGGGGKGAVAKDCVLEQDTSDPLPGS